MANLSESRDSLFLVPEGKCDVLQTVGVGYTSNAVLAPSVSSLPRLVVGEICQKNVS